MSRFIPLSKGHFATVDEEDFESLSKHRWSIHKGWGDTFYAIRYNKGKRTLMHTQIMGHEKGKVIDHKNRDGLDNRKENMRFATRGQNRANAVVSVNSRSGIKGVIARFGKWVASAQYSGKMYHLGVFNESESAKKAYDNFMNEKFGQFARSK